MKSNTASAVEAARELPVGSHVDPHYHGEADLLHVARLAALGTMVTGLAHEISQPLFAIQNFTRAAISTLSQPAPLDRDHLLAWTRGISLEVDRAATIVSRLRNFSRKAAPCAALHDVSQLVQEAADLVLPQARLQEIAIEISLDEQARTVYADRIGIEQVLVNLLKNACEAIAVSHARAAPAGRVIVRARLRNGWVHFSVSDTGSGLPPVDQWRLFEPFFSTKPEGVGIGLAVSRSIVEAAHGRLWAEPNAPHGAVFHFAVPSTQEAIDEQ